MNLAPRRMGASAPVTKQIAYAVAATLRGDASPAQARLAMMWVINRVSQAGTVSAAATAHETAFLEGRRSVGVEINMVAKLDGDEISKLED